VDGDTYCDVFAGAYDGCTGKGGLCDVFVGGYDETSVGRYVGVPCGCEENPLLLL